MAPVAPCAQVGQFKPKVRTALNRELMVGMQVALVAVESIPQLRQNLLDGRRPEFELPEIPNHVRFPAAVHAPPLVPDEAQHPKSSVSRVVAASRRTAALPVVAACCRCPVDPAVRTMAEKPASGFAARPEREGGHETHKPTSATAEWRWVLFAFAFDFDYDSDYDSDSDRRRVA